MSKVAMTEVTMEKCLLIDTPHEILFEIFRRLPKGKLIEISKLFSKFRLVAGDTRLWKDVSIKYVSGKALLFEMFAFEDLYSEPWPVKVIDLSKMEINPPVSLQTEQMIKVTKLNLSSTIADEVTIAAILAKYQCTELYLDGDILRIIGPEAFSKQTSLEVLSVLGIYHDLRDYVMLMSLEQVCQLLAPILKYFKNLKTLDLSQMMIDHKNFDISSFAKTLPPSLEKLFLRNCPEDHFFELLAERTPNLRELKILFYLKVEYQSLLKFQFLEVLHFHYSSDAITPSHLDNISDLYMYLTKFPALKTVYIILESYAVYTTTLEISPESFPGKLRTMLQPHGIIVEITEFPKWTPYVEDGNLWKVSKSV